MTELPDVAVCLAPGAAEDLVVEFLTCARHAHLTTGVELREDRPYAGIEWLLPTAVMIWLAEKYFGAMLEEAGKQHHDALRQALGRIVRRTTGVGREVNTLRLVSQESPKKVSEGSSPVLSVFCLLRTGHRVKFIFEHSLPETSHGPAIDSMHDLMARHYESPDGGDLVADLIVHGVYRERLIVLRYEDAQRAWIPWNPRNTLRR